MSVDYATAEGTAANGVKFLSTSGTLAFATGETNQTIAVPILNNGFVEGAKTFKVILSNLTNARLARARTSPCPSPRTTPERNSCPPPSR